MSKLAIVLYAAAIIASASAGSSTRNRSKQPKDKLREAAKNALKDIVYPADLAVINRQTVHRHINHSIEKIEERSGELYRQVLQLGPQTGAERVTITMPYSQKVLTQLLTLESFLNHFVTVSNKGSFDPTPCRGHYVAYEKAVNTHMDKLMSEVSYVVYSETTMKIGQLLHMANEEISKIRNLRVQATTCNGLECNDISKAAKDIEVAYHMQTTEGLQDYMNMIEKTAITQKLDVSLQYFTDMGLKVMQSVYGCIFRTSKPSAEL